MHLAGVRVYQSSWVDDGEGDPWALSRHYTDQPHPVRDRRRVSALVEVDEVHGWGAPKNNDRVSGDRVTAPLGLARP